MISPYFSEFEPNALIEDAVTTKKGRTLIVKDQGKFAVELAAQSKQEDTDSEVKALGEASRIIRRVLLKLKEKATLLISKALSKMSEEAGRNF